MIVGGCNVQTFDLAPSSWANISAITICQKTKLNPMNYCLDQGTQEYQVDKYTLPNCCQCDFLFLYHSKSVSSAILIFLHCSLELEAFWLALAVHLCLLFPALSLRKELLGKNAALYAEGCFNNILGVKMAWILGDGIPPICAVISIASSSRSTNMGRRMMGCGRGFVCRLERILLPMCFVWA